IRVWRLKKNIEHTAFEVFENESVCLIVSGIGKIKSAAATTYLFTTGQLHTLWNIGICGSSDTSQPIGSIWRIHKITDVASGRDFYPDGSIRMTIGESALQTVDRPQENKSLHPKDASLYDMEASGFFSAATRFLSLDRIHVIKIVSDHLQIQGITSDFVENLMTQSLPQFVSSLDILSAMRIDKEVLSASEWETMNKIFDTIRPSQTQRLALEETARSYKIRYGQLPGDLMDIIGTNGENKQERNARVERLRQKLIQ
ncbi:MAG TPA: hypothetical protein PLG25_08045, partial [bacterium]|nr:hypothetical protein [bacterium]